MMFDIFKRSTVDNLVNGAYKVPPVVPPIPNMGGTAPECQYTVGTTSDGMTVLKVGDSYITTLTMNEAATRQLIRMLEATLRDSDHNDQ